jgi:hypothetical protein
MDPNETLRTMRGLSAALQSQEWMELDADIAGDLAIAFQDLDGWLSQGGFLPSDWAGGTSLEDQEDKHRQDQYDMVGSYDWLGYESMENEGGICD